MIECFKVGKYYRWIGPKKRQSGWNSDGLMDGVLDGKPHKCIQNNLFNPFYANFNCCERPNGDTWIWFDGVNFEELPEQLEFNFD